MVETRDSPELAAITRRWARALITSQGELMANLLAQSDPVLFCGTAENETHCGDALRNSFAAHVKEIPAGKILACEIHAYETGETGWALWDGQMQFPSKDTPTLARITLVFVLENGIWKVQHIHNSFPASNIEHLGYAHTPFDQLLAAALLVDPQIGQSGSATVMFTDIAGSSTLAESLGDTRWTSVVQSHVAMIDEALEAENGRLVKSLGDGTMSTFASAGAAMRAAQAIQRRVAASHEEPRLQLRIGLHTGDVVQAGNDFFGTVVNKAARIAGAAGPGEIRVSEATRIMVGGARDFTFGDPATLRLRGLDGEHLIHRLDWAD